MGILCRNLTEESFEISRQKGTQPVLQGITRYGFATRSKLVNQPGKDLSEASRGCLGVDTGISGDLLHLVVAKNLHNLIGTDGQVSSCTYPGRNQVPQPALLKLCHQALQSAGLAQQGCANLQEVDTTRCSLCGTGRKFAFLSRRAA